MEKFCCDDQLQGPLCYFVLQNFEKQMRGHGYSAFDAKGQDLYRQVMCKKAWINRSPGKGND